MSNTQYTTIARSFVDEIFNAHKTEEAEDYVTPDIIYHGMSIISVSFYQIRWLYEKYHGDGSWVVEDNPIP